MNNDKKHIDGNNILYDNEKKTIIKANVDIEYFEVPESVVAIAQGAFKKCTKLINIKMSENIRTIGEYAFMDCEHLENVTLSKNITTLPQGLFQNCFKLKKLHIPKNVKEIHEGAFCNCFNLEELTVDNENKYFVEYNKILYDKAMIKLIKCVSTKKWCEDIYESVEYICDSAFENCNLYFFRTSNNVKEVGKNAFKCCKKLNSVYIGKGVGSIEYRAFYECSDLVNIDISKSVTKINPEAFAYCKSLQSIVIPENVEVINDGTFIGCSNLKYVVIVSPNTEIKPNAFNKIVKIIAHKNSKAEKYAKEKGFDFECINTLSKQVAFSIEAYMKENGLMLPKNSGFNIDYLNKNNIILKDDEMLLAGRAQCDFTVDDKLIVKNHIPVDIAKFGPFYGKDIDFISEGCTFAVICKKIDEDFAYGEVVHLQKR